MDGERYKPWRERPEPDELLEAQAGQTWRALLDESRRCVDALKQVTREADRRLGLGARMIDALRRRNAGGSPHERIERQLAAFEVRLGAMETRLSDLNVYGRQVAEPPRRRLATPRRKAA